MRLSSADHHMKSLQLLPRFAGSLAFVLAAFSANAGPPSVPEHGHEHETTAPGSAVNWLTGEGVSLGGVLFPHVHFQSAYGSTTADEVEHFGAGHHDPVSDGWTIQGFEFGASLRAQEWFEAFGTYHLYQDAATNDWDDEFEEWFGKIKNIPGGFELRGGRYLNRFGFHNSVHLHGWSYIDNNLVNGRFLGDDGLYSIGGEITWNLPTPWTSILSVSVGEAQGHDEHEHAHAHEHGEEHEHEHSWYEPEDALFDSTVITANWTTQWDYNDFHQFRFGVSGAWGDNKMRELTQVYGVHFQYEWRQNGYEAGGRYFRWRSEAMVRGFDYYAEHEEEEEHEDHDEPGHHEEHDDHDHAGHEEEHHHVVHKGSDTEFGLYTAFAYGLDNGLEFGLRAEYVSGLEHTEFSERYRASPNVTYFFNPARTLYLRGQYNYDYSPAFKDEHSVWLQVGFNWGGAEVR